MIRSVRKARLLVAMHSLLRYMKVMVARYYVLIQVPPLNQVKGFIAVLTRFRLPYYPANLSESSKQKNQQNLKKSLEIKSS